MRDSLHLYFRYLGVSVRGQMQYKASFVMLSFANFFGNSLDLVTLWILFDRFKSLRGWTLAEAAMLYGMVNLSFAIAEATTDGFDRFADMVKSGDFDRILLRPRSTVLQILGQEIRLMRVGRLSLALIVLVWSANALDISWSPAKLVLLTYAVIAGACIFAGLFILQATMAFWTIESLEIMNTMTYGGVETAQYPLSIYKPWFRGFFTLVVPLACISYLPSLVITDRSHQYPLPEILLWLAPTIGIVFLYVSTRIWRIGVRRYCSTGS